MSLSSGASRSAATCIAVAVVLLVVLGVAGGTPVTTLVTELQPLAATANRTSIPVSWTIQTRRSFNVEVGGRNVYEYLRYRVHHRKRHERLAVVLGVDHVATYDGHRVDATYRLVRLAQSNGYQVFFVTGSPLPRAARLLARDGYAGYQDLARCSGSGGEERQARCKARYRAHLVRSGHTLVANVGAHPPAWRYGPQAERTIKLRY